MIREWLVELMEWMAGDEVMTEVYLMTKNCATCNRPLYEIFREHAKRWHGTTDQELPPIETFEGLENGPLEKMKKNPKHWDNDY